MNKILSAAVGFASFGMVSAVQAAPMLMVNVYENDALVGSLSQSSTTGNLVFGGLTPSFMVDGVTVRGARAPGETILASTQLSTSARAGADFGSGITIRYEITQTGLTSSDAGGLGARFANSFTANSQQFGQIASVVLTNYVDATNAAFGRGTLVATQTYTGGPTNDSGQIIGAAPLSGALFSETSVIEARFLSNGATLSTSAQIVAVPEPASLALFGSALLGLGMVRRSRRSKA